MSEKAVMDAPVQEQSSSVDDAIFDKAPASQPSEKKGMVSFAEAFTATLKDKEAGEALAKGKKPQQPAPEAKETPPQAPDAADKKKEAAQEQPKQRDRDQNTGRFKAFGAETPEGEAAKPESDKDLNFRNLRTKLEAAEAKVREYEAKSSLSHDPAEIEGYKSKIAEYEKKLAKVSYESSEEYRSKYAAPMEDIVKQATELVDPKNAAKLAFVLDMLPGQNRTQALQSIIEDAPDAVRFEILGLAREAGKIAIERQKALGNPQARMEEIQRAEQARKNAIAEQEKRFVDELITGTAAEAAKAFPEFFGQKDGDEGHNTAVKNRLNAVREFMIPDPNDQDRPTKIAEAAFYSVIGREAAPIIARANKEIAKLTKEIETLKGARPAINGSAPQGGGERKSFMDKFRAGLAGEA